jgi:O-antigen/teichoic acid export membrane protein
MANESQSSYRQIIKATSIFGGVQVYQIILAIVRSKIVAVLLGTTGMGISGLLVSVTSLVSGLTNLGLGVSAVRNVSDAHGAGDIKRVALVATVLKKLVWITGLAGSVIMLVLAPWFSQLTFGNNDYTWAFRILSGTMLLANISSSQYVLLQGLRKLKELAKANAMGATLGLLVSIPLYYYYGLAGIVPALVITAITTLLLALYFGRIVTYKPVDVSLTDVWMQGKGMIQMGVLLSLSSLVGLAVGYFTRIYISHKGTLSDVGLYNAGFAMVNTYVGMIFTAMSTDYYPRLSGVAQDVSKSNKLINQQAEIGILILGPILILFMILLKYAIIILFSSDFLEVIPMVQWSVIAILLKAVVWATGFLIIAKGASTVFFYSELIGSIYSLLLNIAGYYWFGLEGLGISFLVTYFISIFQNFCITKYLYKFSFDWSLGTIMIVQLLLIISSFVLIRMTHNNWTVVFNSLIFIIATSYSIYELNKKIDLAAIIDKIRNRA